eukprot:gene948-1466_t
MSIAGIMFFVYTTSLLSSNFGYLLGSPSFQECWRDDTFATEGCEDGFAVHWEAVSTAAEEAKAGLNITASVSYPTRWDLDIDGTHGDGYACNYVKVLACRSVVIEQCTSGLDPISNVVSHAPVQQLNPSRFSEDGSGTTNVSSFVELGPGLWAVTVHVTVFEVKDGVSVKHDAVRRLQDVNVSEPETFDESIDRKTREEMASCRQKHRLSDDEGLSECISCPRNTDNSIYASYMQSLFNYTSPDALNTDNSIYASYMQSLLNYTSPDPLYVSIEQCLPKEGYYGNPGEKATICPIGGVCCACPKSSFATIEDGLGRLRESSGAVINYDSFCSCLGGAVPYPFPSFGYYRSEEPSFEHEMIPCGTEDRCEGAIGLSLEHVRIVLGDLSDQGTTLEDAYTVLFNETITNTHCKVEGRQAYAGRLCASCATDHFSISGYCYECPDGKLNKLFFTMAMMMLVVLAWVFLGVYMGGSFASLNQLLLYLQISSMLFEYNMDWPSSVQSWAYILTVVNFDLDVMGLECIAPSYGYAWTFFMQFLLPPTVLLGNLAIYAGKWLYIYHYRGLGSMQATQQLSHEWRLRTSSEIVYQSLCNKCFEPWMCYEYGNNAQYMMQAPEIQCWTGMHIPILVTSVAMFFVYVLGVPAVYFSILFSGYKKNALMDASFKTTYGWMYEMYEREWVYWIVMILLRLLSCAATLVFLQRYPALQSLLTIIVLIIATVSHFFARPFIDTSLDLMESMNLLSLIFIVISGMIFYTKDLDAIDDHHGVYTTVWVLLMFIVIGLQMAFAFAICGREVLVLAMSFKSVQAFSAAFDVAIKKYDARHCVTVAHLDGLRSKAGEGQKRICMSFQEFQAVLQSLDDGLHPAFKTWHARQMFHLAASIRDLGDDPRSAGVQEEPDSSASIAAEIEIESLMGSVAVDYMDMLFKNALLSIKSLCAANDSNSNATISLEELEPVWHAGMPPKLAKEVVAFMLHYLLQLAPDKRQLPLHVVDSILQQFLFDKLGVFHALRECQEKEEKPHDIINACVVYLSSRDKDDEAEHAARRSRFSVFQPIVELVHDLSSKANLHPFDKLSSKAEMCKDLLSIMNPQILQVRKISQS